MAAPPPPPPIMYYDGEGHVGDYRGPWRQTSKGQWEPPPPLPWAVRHPLLATAVFYLTVLALVAATVLLGKVLP